MNGTALGANTENIIFISEAHEKFYYEKLEEVRMQECIHIENPQDAIFHYISWWKERFFIIRKLLGTKYYEPAEILIRNIHQKYIRQVFDTKVDIPMKAKDINFMMEFMAAGLTTFFFIHCNDVKFDEKEASKQILSLIARCTGMEQI